MKTLNRIYFKIEEWLYVEKKLRYNKNSFELKDVFESEM